MRSVRQLGVIEWFAIATCFWIGATLGYVFRNKFGFLLLAPHELGSFLQGVFSPLAFSWLVAAVLFQRRELQGQIQHQEAELVKERLENGRQRFINAIRTLADRTGVLGIQVGSQAKRTHIFGLPEDYDNMIDIRDTGAMLETFKTKLSRLEREMGREDFEFITLNSQVLSDIVNGLRRIVVLGREVVEIARLSGDVGAEINDIETASVSADVIVHRLDAWPI